MKAKALLALLVGASAIISGCNTTVSSRNDTYCYYDYYGYYVCDYYYYFGDGSVETSKDTIANVAEVERVKLETQASHYASKFNLSAEQGMKIAKTVTDYSALQNRSEQDLADFATRLYGVAPSKIAEAASAAQSGDSSKFNSLITEAAKNFDTSAENMKSIVKTLHGDMLQANGVNL